MERFLSTVVVVALLAFPVLADDALHTSVGSPIEFIQAVASAGTSACRPASSGSNPSNATMSRAALTGPAAIRASESRP